MMRDACGGATGEKTAPPLSEDEPPLNRKCTPYRVSIMIREPLNNSSAAGQRIFSPIRSVQKTGNTYSIPPFSKPSAEEKSLAASSCRIIQSFLRVICHISTMVLIRNHRAFSKFKNHCGIRLFDVSKSTR